MKKQFLVGLALGAIVVTGCGSPNTAERDQNSVTTESHQSDEGMAAETLNQMLEVAAQGDWKAYVLRYYGEQSKFRSPADRDALVRRFEQKWGEQVVHGLRRAALVHPRIDGDRALFMESDDTIFVLHRGEDGDWKFHL